MTAPKIDTQAPDTSRAYIERMIQCAPFADQTAGVPEMAAALGALLAERDALLEAVALVRQNMNTQINGGMGWMADFEAVVSRAE